MRAVFVIILLAFSLSACARPVGDLGRAKPGVVHDQVLPAVGTVRAKMFGEPVSNFNWTDQEREMHDRAWRFLIAPHSHDWFFNVLVEWQRTRISPYQDTTHTYDRYYAYLRFQKYRSSRVRYNRVADDIRADVETIPGVFRAICAVIEVDQQRRTAEQSLPGIEISARQNVTARHQENQAYIAWFVRSARYRYASYTYALEHLLVETPHEEARLIDAELSAYAVWVERAEAHDFCYDAQDYYLVEDVHGPKSRMHSRPFTKEPSFRK